jgi:hypothetical protein
MTKPEEAQDLRPSEKPILVSGPAKVPKVSCTSGIPFPNLNVILAEATLPNDRKK